MQRAMRANERAARPPARWQRLSVGCTDQIQLTDDVLLRSAARLGRTTSKQSVDARSEMAITMHVDEGAAPPPPQWCVHRAAGVRVAFPGDAAVAHCDDDDAGRCRPV